MSRPLAGRVALVTGGSRGVGRGIAVRLAADGAAVAVNYRRDAAAAADVVEEIAAAGCTAKAYAASVTDEGAMAAMVDAVAADLGPVDLLVSNAGTASRGTRIGETARNEYQRLLDVHVLGPLELVRLLLPQLRAAGRADIVVVSSAIVHESPPGTAAYVMAKAALESAMRVLAREERAHGIRVNVVAPGLVATDMGERLVASAAGATIAELDPTFPFGRVARPSDVAGVVAFLASQDGQYLTGERIRVDAGGPDQPLFV